MDQLVRIVLWIALFGGTGAVILIILPQVVVWCLEVVDGFQRARAHGKALAAPHADRTETAETVAQHSTHVQAG